MMENERRSLNRLAGVLLLLNFIEIAAAELFVRLLTVAPLGLTESRLEWLIYDSGLLENTVALLSLLAMALLLRPFPSVLHERVRMAPGQLLKALLAVNGLQLLALLVSAPLESWLATLGYGMEAANEWASGSSPTVLMLLYSVVVAPIVEEFSYRGLLQRRLEPFGRGFAIVTTAVCFGLMHGNLVQLFPAVAVGLLFGYVAQRFSLRAAIVLHMMNNLWVEASAALPETAEWLWVVDFAIMLGGGAYVLYWLITRRREVAARFDERDGESAWLLLRCPLVWCMVVLFGALTVLSIFE